MNDLFDTGAEVKFNLGRNSGGTKAKFVKRSGTTQIEDGSSIAIPFNTSAGSGQSATLTLSDVTSDVTVSYDETTEAVTVDG